MKHSLSNRLTFRIMAVVLVMMSVITSLVYFSVRNYMLEEAQGRYLGILQRDHEEFRRRLSNVVVAAENNIHNIEQDIDHPEKLMAHLERILHQNATILTSGVLYEPNYFPDKARCVELFASRDSADELHLGHVENDHCVYVDRIWFKRCLETDTADWSEVYFEENLIPNVTGRRQLTTYSMPIHDKQGRPVAVFGSDLKLEFLGYELMDDLKELHKKYEKGCKHHSYNFVIDHQGTYIIHPDESRIQHANFFEECKRTAMTDDDCLINSMMKGEKGSEMVDIDGVPSWIYYRPVKHMNWVIAIVVPEEVIFRNGRMLSTLILLIMALGLVAIWLICRRAIKKTTAYIERDLTIAHNIQMAMLPKPLVSHSGYDLYASLTPAREVGGDLYDYLVRDGRLFFCIGDVSGKGVPAALVMAVTRSLFHTISMGEHSPERIVWRINSAICDGNEVGVFVTMFVGVLDLASGRLDYCNAGHEAPLILSETSEAKSEKLPVKRNLPVGALSDWTFEGQQTLLQPGDALFLYTDGLTEAKNRSGRQLGRQHVVQLAAEHTNDSAQQLVALMENEVHHHVADTEQSDDITLLALRWHPDSLRMQASMDHIHLLQPYIEGVAQTVGFDSKETHRLRLAVEETVANVINYGEATVITLHATTSGDQLLLTIDDDGKPFDPTQESATDLSVPADERPAGGMGLILLHRMTDSLNYQRINGHNILTLAKTINFWSSESKIELVRILPSRDKSHGTK